MQIPQAIEEMEKLLSYYPFNTLQHVSKDVQSKKSTIASLLSQKFLGLDNLEKSVRYALLAIESQTFNLIPELFFELFQKEREDLAISFASQAKGNNQQQAFFELALHFFSNGLFKEGSDFAKKVDLPPLQKMLESEMKRSLPPLTD